MECPRPRLSQDEGLGCLSSDQRALSGQCSLPIPPASSPASQLNPPTPRSRRSQAAQHSPGPQPCRASAPKEALTSLPAQRAPRSALPAQQWSAVGLGLWTVWPAPGWVAHWSGCNSAQVGPVPEGSQALLTPARLRAHACVPARCPGSPGAPGPEPSAREASRGPSRFCGPQPPIRPTGPASSCCRRRPRPRARRSEGRARARETGSEQGWAGSLTVPECTPPARAGLQTSTAWPRLTLLCLHRCACVLASCALPLPADSLHAGIWGVPIPTGFYLAQGHLWPCRL